MLQRMQAMEGTIQSLMTENVQLKAHVQASNDGLQTAFTQQTAVLGELAEGIKKLGSKPQAAMLVDSRGSGKPAVFQNVEDSFPAWLRKTENYICGVFGEEFRKVLEWAIEHEGEIRQDEVDDTLGDSARSPSSVFGLFLPSPVFFASSVAPVIA